jgi:hypothetical protein
MAPTLQRAGLEGRHAALGRKGAKMNGWIGIGVGIAIASVVVVGCKASDGGDTGTGDQHVESAAPVKPANPITLSGGSCTRTPASVGSAKDIADLEDEAREGTDMEFKCEHVIVVRTGGSLGSALAGICTAPNEGDLGKTRLLCRNNMTGSTAKSPRSHPEITEESELLQLIDEKCTGG